MDIVSLTAAAVFLFAIIALLEPLSSRLRVPYAILLCVVGASLGFGAAWLSGSPLASQLGWEVRQALSFQIPSVFMLSVLLPVLIFQVALCLDIRRMLEDWAPILIMAILAVVIATGVIGLTLVPFAGIGLFGCLLIGSIISTTDPSAVIDIFKSISAPQRLVRIIQGESLLNDATAIALFGFFLTFVRAGAPNPHWSDIFIEVPVSMGGGLLIGWLGTRVMFPMILACSGFILGQITLTVALPFAVFQAAEQLGISGVVAVFSAGVFLNLSARSRLSGEEVTALRNSWSLIAHWAGGLIFLLSASLIPRMLEDARLVDIAYVGIALLAALAARALVLWGILPLLSWMRLSPHIEPAYRKAILWGGLRGAVTLALALAVYEARLVPYEVKRAVGIIATGYVIAAFLIQGLTLRPLIRKLGLDVPSPIDQALGRQLVSVALQDIREEVSDRVKQGGINPEIVRAEAKRFGDMTREAIGSAEEFSDILDSERVTLGLIALASQEREFVLTMTRAGRIDRTLQEELTDHAERLYEQTRNNGRSGYRAASRQLLGQDWQLALASRLHLRLRISAPLARIIGKRIEKLITLRALLADLHVFADERIRRIHGRRVTEILHDVLDTREEKVTALLEGFHLQFPGYTDEIERRWIRQIALRLEEKQYDTLLGDNLVSSEMHKTLSERISMERAALKRRPKLDIRQQKVDLLKGLPILKDYGEATILKLAKALHVRHFAPGDILQAKDHKPGKICLIAAGAAEVVRKDKTYRVGPGDFFGHISVLRKTGQQALIRSLTHGVLFELDEVKFRALVDGSSALKETVANQASRAGISLEKPLS